MPDAAGVEQNVSQENLSDKYDLLISRFPLGNLSEAPTRKLSFPDWDMSSEEETWADSYLELGDNKGVLELFGKSLGYVGTRGLQLLREQASRRQRDSLEELENCLAEDSLLDFLRAGFQVNALFYEEGLRGARDVEDKYWLGEGNQLTVAGKSLGLSLNAFREVDQFKEGKTKNLDATRRWIDLNFNALRNIAEHNENFFRENLNTDERVSIKSAELAAKQDAKELVLWSYLKGFVDNLELTSEHESK